MATIVLTAIGDDQAGLVDALASIIADHGGNWEESHMAQLAGKFAGIVVASVADTRTDDLVAALYPLEARGLLDITVEVAAEPAAASARSTFQLELLGQDRLGIIAELSRTLATNGISIEKLHTETRPAPHAGGILIEARAEISGPAGITAADVLAHLAILDEEFMIEMT